MSSISLRLVAVIDRTATVGVSRHLTVFRGTPAVHIPPSSRTGRPRSQLVLVNATRPTTVRALPLALPVRAWRRVTWRNGTNRPWAARFAALRVTPANEWRNRRSLALKALARMMERSDALGFTSPDHYLWFACKWNKLDPTKPIRKWDTAWRAIRDKANLPGLRFHDLRHTAITELAEMGVPDSVLKSIAGHITQRMLEHYSHIRMNARMNAKRQALDGLDAYRAEEVLRSLSHADAEKVQ